MVWNIYGTEFQTRFWSKIPSSKFYICSRNNHLALRNVPIRLWYNIARAQYLNIKRTNHILSELDGYRLPFSKQSKSTTKGLPPMRKSCFSKSDFTINQGGKVIFVLLSTIPAILCRLSRMKRKWRCPAARWVDSITAMMGFQDLKGSPLGKIYVIAMTDLDMLNQDLFNLGGFQMCGLNSKRQFSGKWPWPSL